jgi:IS30 family transposase
LLRRYFPKGTDLSGLTPRTLRRVERSLNERPGQTLAWNAPAEEFGNLMR